MEIPVKLGKTSSTEFHENSVKLGNQLGKFHSVKFKEFNIYRNHQSQSCKLGKKKLSKRPREWHQDWRNPVKLGKPNTTTPAGCCAKQNWV